MTRFYFVRHAATAKNGTVPLPRTNDEPLSDVGRAEILTLIEGLPKDFTVLVTSEIDRATETVNLIKNSSDFTGDIISDSRINKVFFGSLAMKTWEELAVLYPEQCLEEKYHGQEYDLTEFGGESFMQMRDRILSFMNDINMRYPKEGVVIITHGSVLRALYKHFKNEIPEKIPTASVHVFDMVFDFYPKKYKVEENN